MSNRTTRIAAYVVAVEDGAILLCRLSPGIAKYAGWWTLPGGGLEFGEHPEAAAVRETNEETGIDVCLKKLLAIESQVLGEPGEECHNLRLIFRGAVSGGELRDEQDESTDRAAWVRFEDAKNLRLVPLAAHGVALARAFRKRTRALGSP